MERLYKISLVAVLIAAFSVSCKKTLPYTPDHQNDYVLEATVSGTANYDGTGNITYNIKSTKTDGFGQSSFVPWTMEFSTDGGSTWSSSKPNYLTLTVKEDNGGTEAKSYTAKFTAQEKTIGGTSADILKAREILNDVDLAHRDIHGNTHSNGKTTANCYVIHNPGTYKFPTVYGNSIKNGATNEKAYKSSKTGANILKNFLRADGNAIDKPEIEGIANACLIWQDTKDLISEIKYENNYVSFAVKKETIHNGNAIIAVRNSANEILWSWHIWVTEEDLTPVEITNKQGVNYNILPINLGWCGMNAEVYAQREVLVKIKQTEGNKVQEVILRQTKFKLSLRDGNNPYFQWGRKDPMLPGNGVGDADKTCFTTDIQYAFQHTGLNTTDINEYIKNPHKFNIKQEMDDSYYNLWSTDNDRRDGNDDKVIKSVYDPSPVGYSLPASNAFTGFTTTGKNVYNKPDLLNVKGNFNKGSYFYTKPDKQGGTIFFLASGYRNYRAGSLNYVTKNGYYWVAGPDDRDFSRYLYFSSGYVSPLDYTRRSYGFAVRPAQEK